MTAWIELDDHFKTTIARDVMSMVLGRYDGAGTHRAIFDHATDPNLVVKVQSNPGEFHNIQEWEVWQSVKNTPALAKWFAPCEQISPNGRVLVMKRCEPLRKGEEPKKVPSFFTDLKRENWGRYQGRVVCLDYGLHLLYEYGTVSTLKTARWDE